MTRARIRTIKPELLEDERIGQLSRDARLCLIALMTLADDEGRLRASAAYVKGQRYAYDHKLPIDAVESWLLELHRERFVTMYVVKGQRYAEITNWLTHQKINRPSPSKLPSRSESDQSITFDKQDVTLNSVNTHGIFTEASVSPQNISVLISPTVDPDRGPPTVDPDRGARQSLQKSHEGSLSEPAPKEPEPFAFAPTDTPRPIAQPKQPELISDPVVAVIDCKGEPPRFELKQSQFDSLAKEFPDLDAQATLNGAVSANKLADPKDRVTARGSGRYLRDWFKREREIQDVKRRRNGSRPPTQADQVADHARTVRAREQGSLRAKPDDERRYSARAPPQYFETLPLLE